MYLKTAASVTLLLVLSVFSSCRRDTLFGGRLWKCCPSRPDRSAVAGNWRGRS